MVNIVNVIPQFRISTMPCLLAFCLILPLTQVQPDSVPLTPPEQVIIPDMAESVMDSADEEEEDDEPDCD